MTDQRKRWGTITILVEFVPLDDERGPDALESLSHALGIRTLGWRSRKARVVRMKTSSSHLGTAPE